MRQLILSLIGFGIVGCAGNAPSNPNGGDDTPMPDASMPDAPPAPVVQKLSGKTMDYFTPNTPMDLVTLASDGVTPPMSTMSATGGLYSIDSVPTGSKVFFTLTRTNYRPTRNAPVSILAADVVKDLYIATIADINRQYATAGKPVTAGKAFFAAELQRDNGMPLTGIAPTDVVLLDANNAPVTVAGTYFFGTNGDIDPAAITSAAFGTPPRVRVAMLDAPPGSYTLKVTYPNGQGGTKTLLTPVTFVADGATLALAGGGMPGGGGGGTTITNPKFTTDIYPKLQKASSGGLGCANCHTLGGPAGNVLKFDLGAQGTLDAMKAIIGVLDLTTPANSLFLTKPLYEPAPYNHPNATFVDINDPDYKLILLWIQQGALI